MTKLSSNPGRSDRAAHFRLLFDRAHWRDGNRSFLLRFLLSVISLMAGLSLAAAPVNPLAGTRPNILFIITDQHRADALGCAGNSWVATPTLDSLAARGIRFTQSFCVNPLCVPSRAAMATSLMPHEIEARAAKFQLPGDVPSLGTEMRSAGYQTVWAGKWHVRPTFGRPGGTDVPGFDCLSNSAVPQSVYGLPEANMHGSEVDAGWANAACAFLRQKHATPFILTLSLLNPHDICGLVNEKKLAESAYPNPLPPLPANLQSPTTVRMEGERSNATRGLKPQWPDQAFQEYLYRYYRYIEASDALIGQVLKTLHEAGLDQNTVVIYTSDHGEMGGAHQLTLKTQPYDEALRVPLILAGPGVPVGVVDTNHLVSGLDLLPTCCELADRKAPQSVRGKSLLPLLRPASAPDWRQEVYASVDTGARERLVRTSDFKYIQLKRPEAPEVLFDLKADPGETRNVVREPRYAAVRENLRHRLEQWMKETHDPFLN